MFHVILPAHLESGASIPNPSGRKVSIRNLVGQACWELASGGCGGGSADKLIQRQGSGKTIFLLRDSMYADNEGFFEFDALVEP